MQEQLPNQPTDRRAMLAGIGGLAAGALLAGKATAGPLTPPPGPIAPTPGPEPRIAVNSTNTPGDPNTMFRITQPGSYYLTGNLIGQPGKHGIAITADNVTLDLCGFTLFGAPNSRSGIVFTGVNINIAVHNGTIRQWTASGLALTPGGENSKALAADLLVFQNGTNGINLPAASIVRNCVSSNNGGDGIRTGSNSVVIDCSASSNAGAGFVGADGCTFTRCVARQHNAAGIHAGSACHVTECTISDGSQPGIFVQSGCVIAGNTIQDARTGIQAHEDNHISRNNIVVTSHAIQAPGVRVTGDGNRIDTNNVVFHSPGIVATVAGNLIIQNSLRSTTPISVVAGNSVGPAITGVTLNLAPHPHGNFVY